MDTASELLLASKEEESSTPANHDTAVNRDRNTASDSAVNRDGEPRGHTPLNQEVNHNVKTPSAPETEDSHSDRTPVSGGSSCVVASPSHDKTASGDYNSPVDRHTASQDTPTKEKNKAVNSVDNADDAAIHRVPDGPDPGRDLKVTGVTDSGGPLEGEDPASRAACEGVVVDVPDFRQGQGTEACSIEVKGEDGDGLGDGEKAELLPNGTQGPQELHDGEEEEEEGGTAHLATSMEDRVQRLSPSAVDLQGRAEAGVDLVFRPYVRRRRPGKYCDTLKSLLPVRPKGPKHILPMSSSGCLNMCTYGWVTPIIIKIYRKGAEVLNSYKLSATDSAEIQAVRLEHYWKEEVERRGRSKASFRRVVFRAFRTRLICTLLFLLMFAFFSLLNPIFLIRSFLEYLAVGEVHVGVGLYYVVGMIVCEMLKSLCIGQSWISNYQQGMRIRAGAITLLFKKILNLKGLKDKSVGELVNLVGNDSQRIFEAMAVGPLVLVGPVVMTAGCLYTWYYLGHWALVGCAVFVGFYPFNTIISRVTNYLRRKCITITDRRVRMMSELLSCIKLIKMYSWEKPFAGKIAHIRLQERGILEKSAMVQSISTGTAILVPTVASALTFIAIVSSSQNLTAAQAFSFVSLLNSMRFVLGVLPYGVKAVSEMTVALERYTTILLMEEMEDREGAPQPPEGIAVEVKDATLTWSTVDSGIHDMTEKKKKSGDSNSGRTSKGPKDEEKEMLKVTPVNSTMAESSSESAILTDITFSLKKGQLLGVCGSVGSGKSSLIQAVLGRMDTVSGSIAVGGSIAYVPQQAWIMNATVRDNVLFGCPFHEDRYQRVVEACALQTDLDSMVSGDLTEVGERGINLSGGQKQRISMARALYSDRDVYLLDDPLSAVDIHIGRHIFTNCISGFLAGKSVIFVTHQLQYLPMCDSILFLKDGQVLEKGDHSSLMELGGEYSAIMRIFYKETTTDMEGGTDKTEMNAEGNTELSSSPLLLQSLSTSNRASVSRVVLERALSCGSKTSRVEEMVASRAAGEQTTADMVKGGKLIQEEQSPEGGMDWPVFQAYMKAAGGYCVTFIIFLVFLLSITVQNSAPFFLSYWLGQGSGNTTIEVDNRTVVSVSITDHPLLSTYTLIYGMIIIAILVLLVIRAVCFMKLTLRASSTMHDEVFEKVLHCPMAFFDSTPLGRIVNRFSSDMDEVDVRLPMTADVFLSNIMHILFSLGLIAYVAPWFLLALLPLVVTFFVIYRIFTRTVRDIKRMDMVSRAPLISHVTASTQGIATIHAYGKGQQFLTTFCNMLNKNSIPFIMFFISNRWLALRLDLICATITGVTSLIIILTNEQITPALAGLALSSAIQMTGLFQFTVRLATETEARFTSVQRVVDYAKTVESEAAAIIPDKRPSRDWPSNGQLVFRNVQMRYRPNLPLVLKGVSFKVNPQEKIGIVGRTGSGKSSLGVVLFRLVELSGGTIRIDDLNIGTMGLEDLRSHLSIIPQDPVLFIGTVRYNLDPLNNHSDGELWTALKKCHIKDTIASLEQQLDTLVVENGENFSVGERQLLCMARALLRHSKILMLDEATAAIDTETDALVQATLKEAFWDCTMLIIAHRLNTVMACDKILVLDDGKVLEFDRPSTLMSKPESLFRNMLQASENSVTHD